MSLITSSVALGLFIYQSLPLVLTFPSSLFQVIVGAPSELLLNKEGDG
jgi:hypothetical protein